MAGMLCRECGAGVTAGLASCPLCGAEEGARKSQADPAEVVDIDTYQQDVRELREQLRRLREEGADAV